MLIITCKLGCSGPENSSVRGEVEDEVGAWEPGRREGEEEFGKGEGGERGGGGDGRGAGGGGGPGRAAVRPEARVPGRGDVAPDRAPVAPRPIRWATSRTPRATGRTRRRPAGPEIGRAHV